MDYKGYLGEEPFEGGEGRDQLVELGSGRLIPGFEEQVVGATAGESREITVTFPADYQAEHLAGREARFELAIKEVKAKQLPELDDDFASDNAGFDSLEELRADIAEKLAEAEGTRVEGEFREAVLDAVVANSTVEVPAPLVEARAKELWERMIHTLSHQGISKEIYLQISGKTEEQILEEGRPEAEQALKREAVIAAIVEAEQLEPSEGDLLDALQDAAARESTTPEVLRERLEKAGRLDELKSDLAQRMAIDLITEHATPISVDQARARKLIWTPDAAEREAEGSAAGGRLWTPGE
jgi:trigger factor